MAAPRQGLPVRLDRAPQRGAAFALTRASRRARTTGSSLIFDHPPAVAPAPPPPPGPAHYLVAPDHRFPAFRHVHLLMNVLHRDLHFRSSRADSGPQALPPARATVLPWLPAKSARVSNLPACCALGPPVSAAPCSCRREPCTGRSAWPPLGRACLSAWIEHRNGEQRSP